MGLVILLGPQRHVPTVNTALERLGVQGAVAVVTAGWQERESEVDELREHVQRPVANLRLHERAEDVFQSRPEVFEALRRRQTRLKRLQGLYRLRLHYVLDGARALLRHSGDEDLVEPERAGAIKAVRILDAHHRRRLREIHQQFETSWGDTVAEAVADHRQEIREILENAGALAVAGGHVAVLLNRLRLFGVGEMLRGPLRALPIVAWSAGAMALARQVVLFHDRPPQGAGNAEVLDLGLGLYPQVLPLPHARHRLHLHDPVRVSLFARRFAPTMCVPMDGGSELFWDGTRWAGGYDTYLLGLDGRPREITPQEVSV